MADKKINKSICVVDNHGGYAYAAAALARWFDNVKYYSRWESSFPTIGASMIGVGIPGVERISSLEDHEDEIDIYFFPDIYWAPVATRLKNEGKKVWGSGTMEYMERDRKIFMESLEEAGLDVPPYVVQTGLDSLIKYLEGKENLWIKMTEFRGSCETWKYLNDKYAEFLVTSIRGEVGPFIKSTEFIVQETIKTKLEYGTDGFIVNGEFPENTFMGFESKGESYFIKLEDSDKLPQGLQDVNKKFSKILKAQDYTGHYSTEVRLGEDDKNYFIDITPRCGYPPSAVMFYLGENWGEIIVNAVEGKATRICRSLISSGNIR